MLRIGLLGYGTVGRSVADLLAADGRGMEVRRILRRPGKAAGPLMTDRPEEILGDPQIDVVVDVLPGCEPSHELMRAALLAGKHVVTANKAALAANYAELTTLARERGRALLFEASCGGGIPWIESIKKAARVDRIISMRGILNGTGNYIIDRIERFGMEFEDALAEAQRLGYAEADPTADIGGADVANKAVISVSLALGMPVERPFPVLGIGRITRSMIESLHARGRTVRHMMIFRREARSWCMGVAPVALPLGSIEASVRDNFNCATFTGDVVGTLKFYGQGAGGRPTADAVLQDLADIRDGLARPVPEFSGEELLWDPGLLAGEGLLGDGSILHGRTLEELALEAERRNAFLAFSPDR